MALEGIVFSLHVPLPDSADSKRLDFSHSNPSILPKKQSITDLGDDRRENPSEIDQFQVVCLHLEVMASVEQRNGASLEDSYQAVSGQARGPWKLGGNESHD